MSDAARKPRPAASVLLVDDQLANLVTLEAVLEPLGHRIVRALSGEQALERLREEEFAVVLLDVVMPRVDGLETADRMRAEEHGRDVPIIFLTGGDTPELDGYARGAVDILRKPLEIAVVRAKVGVFVELYRAREEVRQQAARIAVQERAAEARSAALINASLDAIIGMDARGRVSEFNSAAETMFGRKRVDVLAQPMAELLIPAQLRQAHVEGLARYLATGASRVLDRRIELSALRADGTEFPIELAIGRIAAEGAPAFVAYVRDLTEQKRIEGARTFLARASEAFASSIDYEVTLQTLVRLAVPAIADWCAVEVIGDDPRTSERVAIAHVDPAKIELARELRQRYPINPDAPYGLPNVLRTGRSELHQDVPDELLEHVARDPEHLRLLREIGLRSGMIVPIATRGRIVGAISFAIAESGRRYGPSDLATAEDLARRAGAAMDNARLYQAAQAAQARNRFLADASSALSSSLDYGTTLERVARLAVPAVADSAAVYWLEADGALRLAALASADPIHEARSRELNALLPLHIEQQDRLLPRVLRTARSELLAVVPPVVQNVWSATSRAAELVQQLAIGSYMAVPLVARGRVVGALALTTSAHGRRLGAEDLALAEELAGRAGLAVENAQLYREAQDANRVKDEFLATISHELRTPLTAILGWTHLLRTGSPALAARAIETIERNAHTQARIVDDVLDVSRIISGKLGLKLERIDLADAVRAAIETVRPAAEAKAIDLIVTIDPAAGETIGDPARLQQVAWNLLSNAIKFTPTHGRVETRLERGDSSIVLRVSDSGEGIRPEFLPHVFERFRQADSTTTRAHGGLGLGLAIVRHLVELHGGRVTAESEGDGCGAAFSVTLPIRAAVPDGADVEQHELQRADAMPRQSPKVLDTLRVLVVDDEPDARDLIATLLAQHGADVTTASSTQAAMALIAQMKPDILVSDIGMPGEDGYALIAQARALMAERGLWFPAIALTAYAQIEDRDRAIAAGYQVHLSKPIEPNALIATVAKLAGRG